MCLNYLVLSCFGFFLLSIASAGAPRPEPDFIWFPQDDDAGTLVKAHLSGSPSTMADERDIHFFLFTQ
jgi:hypothetical protein